MDEDQSHLDWANSTADKLRDFTVARLATLNNVPSDFEGNERVGEMVSFRTYNKSNKLGDSRRQVRALESQLASRWSATDHPDLVGIETGAELDNAGRLLRRNVLWAATLCFLISCVVEVPSKIPVFDLAIAQSALAMCMTGFLVYSTLMFLSSAAPGYWRRRARLQRLQVVRAAEDEGLRRLLAEWEWAGKVNDVDGPWAGDFTEQPPQPVQLDKRLPFGWMDYSTSLRRHWTDLDVRTRLAQVRFHMELTLPLLWAGVAFVLIVAKLVAGLAWGF